MMKTGFNQVNAIDQELIIRRSLYAALLNLLMKRIVIFAEILRCHQVSANNDTLTSMDSDHDATNQETKKKNKESGLSFFEAVQDAPVSTSYKDSPVSTSEGVVPDKPTYTTADMEGWEHDGEDEDEDENEDDDHEDENGEDDDEEEEDEEEMIYLLKMAFVYNVLAPDGILNKAKPLFDCVDSGDAMDPDELARNYVIRDLVHELPAYLESASSTPRLLALIQRINSEFEGMDEDTLTKLYVASLGEEPFYEVVEYEGGFVECACKFCTEYHTIFDMYNQYKSGTMDEKTQEAVDSLNLTQLQLTLLDGVDCIGLPKMEEEES